MRVTIWGSRGSLAAAGPDTIRYGGNTACVQVDSFDGSILILDAGTGMRHAGLRLAGDRRPVHVLLTHLHMDHIQGLGFFRPLFEPGREVHIWGPPSTTRDLRARLTRYLSPPLFPVRLRDLASKLELHDVRPEPWGIEGFRVAAAGVVHPGPTVGYRVGADGSALAYLPDHEPRLGGELREPDWTSGFALARDVDLLLHDGQYSDAEYAARVGWGHSSVTHAARLADLAGARELMLIHHDPDHADGTVDELVGVAAAARQSGTVRAASEGLALQL